MEDPHRKWALILIPTCFSKFMCVSTRIVMKYYDGSLLVLSYLIDQGICYLTLTDKNYNKRLAFMFLEEISRDFVYSLKQEYGEE